MEDTAKKSERGKLPDISPAEAYLLLYNSACALGWIGVMSQIGTAFGEGGGVLEAVEASHNMVVILQLLATLEFIHASIGLVKSNPATIGLQVLGRDLVLFSVVYALPGTRGSPWVLMMFTAWVTSEVIRYPFYALSIARMCPPALRWLRYTAFIVLYPLGFAGELGTWIVGLPHMKALGLPALPGLPEGSAIYLLYAYLFLAFTTAAPKLYLHMLRQRKKQLASPREADKAKTP